MNTDAVIAEIVRLKNRYITDRVGNDPAAMPAWLGEFSGYASIIYDHYGQFIEQYERTEAKVIAEENAQMKAVNEGAKDKSERMTITETEQRIAVRLGDLKGKRKKLEQITKGATLHINTCQSLMKNWGDEAKGIR